MGSSRGKTNRAREDAAYNATQASIQQWQPSELEKKQNERVLGFINDVDSGKDVKDIKYVSPYFNLYNNAKNTQNQERLGSGALQLGSQSNPNYVARMREVNSERRQQEAAGQLSNAFNAAYSDATNQQIPFLTGLSEQRHAGKTQANSGLYQTLLHRPKQTPFWQQLVLAGISGGAQVAGAAAGRPPGA